jgi:hypothetical protein
MFAWLLWHRLAEPRVSGGVRPSRDVRTGGRKLVLSVETVRSLRVRSHVRTGETSGGAPCTGLLREEPDASASPLTV